MGAGKGRERVGPRHWDPAVDQDAVRLAEAVDWALGHERVVEVPGDLIHCRQGQLGLEQPVEVGFVEIGHADGSRASDFENINESLVCQNQARAHVVFCAVLLAFGIAGGAGTSANNRRGPVQHQVIHIRKIQHRQHVFVLSERVIVSHVQVRAQFVGDENFFSRNVGVSEGKGNISLIVIAVRQIKQATTKLKKGRNRCMHVQRAAFERRRVGRQTLCICAGAPALGIRSVILAGVASAARPKSHSWNPQARHS